MKKAMIIFVSLLAVSIVMSSMVSAQQKQADKKVSGKFLTTWKKVGNKTKRIRSFDTEKAVTVAGVRGGDEASDAILKNLYFKGGVAYPSRGELKNAIEMLEKFVHDNPQDSTVAETKYFIAQCYIQLDEQEKALAAYNDVIKNHPDTEFAQYAKEEIAALKKK